MSTPITEEDLVQSIADALQFISYYHPEDYIRHLAESYRLEQSPAAKNAMAQILANSRMAAFGRRPICQDTGVVNVFMKIGMGARFATGRPLDELVNEGVRRAWKADTNPLRASMVREPLFDRKNTGDNTPANLHVEMVAGDQVEVHVAAKGGGSENKSRFATLEPSDSVVDWVLRTVETLGAGWCPPGLIGLGIGGSAEKAMLLAKQSLLDPIDMTELRARGPASKLEEMRIELWEKINALGIGAQGLGGLTTVLDVKIRTFPVHAASLPVGLIPQCAADRHAHFVLDGSGPATLTPPDLDLWPEIALDGIAAGARRVDLDRLTPAEVATWRAGETLLLSGKLLTGRDAAHLRMTRMLAAGEPLPVNFRDRAIYYVGPVDAVGDEAVGPAGPTTSTRMDRFTETMLAETGLLVMIGKAERGPAAIEAIKAHGAAYLIAVGGAAYLVSKAIKSARVLAFGDLGMEAIHEFTVVDMPVTVAVDAQGTSVHREGPARWRAAARTA
ncbi:fumarate hydratase class I [Aliidongia dinghuensis]|uniref:Fumarate hydratase class I n=1 Tax=Aliidongia dinghuensis TaxID=1867774 RepID=A0A8J3E308_9PROT|nr:fumarate hydratase [Aliidongia dinghuensis]GGF14590.1 fumarate hydratase class I [Aliidongia dinghuensis]